MNILLIAPTSYNYYKDITIELNNQGHHVDYIKDFNPTFINRSIRYLSKKIISVCQNKYIIKKLSSVKKDYDLIFIIRGYAFSLKSMEKMKAKFPNARMVLYQWDPLTISLFSPESLHLFSRCYTFDYVDAVTYSEFTQKSLFYTESNFDDKIQISSIDISFIGANHSDRLLICSKILEKYSDLCNIYIKLTCNKFKFYIQSLKNLKLYINAKKNGLVLFKPIPRETTQEIFNHSKIVLDIHSPLQRGLSIRVAEVLSKGKKLITTNPYIKQEKYFNSSMIQVIDREDPTIDESFINSDNTQRIDVSYLRLDNWLQDILK